MNRSTACVVVFLVASWLSSTAACSSPPATLEDGQSGPLPFSWAPVLAGLDDALLATCSGGEHGEVVVAVGGRPGAGLVLEWSDDAWHAAALPPGSGVLWWCWIDDSGTPWAAGEGATVLRKQQGRWQRTTIDTDIDTDMGGALASQVTFYGLWGARNGDVYAVGGALGNPGLTTVIAHYDGSRWQLVDTSALPRQLPFKVWGSGPGDVWVVGDGGMVLHHDGTAWTATTTPTSERLIAVWGSSARDVYAVGGAGRGLLLAYDGAAWTELATAPEQLSGVWTAPDQPLYVAGNGGYVARYERRDGRADPARMTRAITTDTCIHGLAGAGQSVLAAAADLAAGGTPSWRGTLLVHGPDSFAGALVPGPDVPDAGLPDASPDAGPDAELPDAGTGPDAHPAPGPGQPCAAPPDVCAGGLECWYAVDSGLYICTELCTSTAECTAYGPDPCCTRPGPQTLSRVCLPGTAVECTQPARAADAL